MALVFGLLGGAEARVAARAAANQRVGSVRGATTFDRPHSLHHWALVCSSASYPASASASLSSASAVETVEEYTLQDLGGLDPTISVTKDSPPEPDFVWFGITERMAESTVLFYFHFKAAPLPKTPVHRIQKCSPTSWWMPEDRATVVEREPADYAVWRAANAILDVRMEKMKMEVQALLDSGATKEQLFHVDWDQLEMIGITF